MFKFAEARPLSTAARQELGSEGYSGQIAREREVRRHVVGRLARKTGAVVLPAALVASLATQVDHFFEARSAPPSACLKFEPTQGGHPYGGDYKIIELNRPGLPDFTLLGGDATGPNRISACLPTSLGPLTFEVEGMNLARNVSTGVIMERATVEPGANVMLIAVPNEGEVAALGGM
jgi:hypothetical protein